MTFSTFKVRMSSNCDIQEKILSTVKHTYNSNSNVIVAMSF